MARPIPVNLAGISRGRQFDTQAYAPTWGVMGPMPQPVRAVPQQAEAPPAAAGTQQESWALGGVLLLGISFLTGGLAVVSSLELWPALAASSVGMDDRGAFFLLVSGIYLLATTLYAVWRTRLLTRLRQAPWDARLMAYANLGMGGAISIALGVIAMAFVAVALVLCGLGALLLSGTGNQTQS